MALLSIRLFGRPRVALGDDVEIKLAHTGQTLLAYLLLHRDFSSRDVLASLCWGEQSDESARSCLNTALWRLRNALEADSVPKGTYLQTTPAGEVGFNWDSPHRLDLSEFEQVVSRALGRSPAQFTPADTVAFERGLNLYTGDLLEGFYDDWALRERERRRGLYLDGLQHLMAVHGLLGAHPQAIQAGQRILHLDPLREDIHRELMRLYALSGQRGLAVRQYLACKEVLHSELGIPPMDETEACYRQIIATSPSEASGAAARESRAAGRAERGELKAALDELAAARRQLQVAQERLSQALSVMEQFAPCT